MPILDIEIVTRSGESIGPQLASELADRAGAIFGSPRGNTWVKVRSLSHDHYAENDSDLGTDVYPVFVSVLRMKRSATAVLQREITQLTAMVAQVCNRSVENVHIVYLPEGSGRVAFGGKVVGN